MEPLIKTKTNSGYIDIVLLMVRFSVGILMLTHGYQKLINVLSGDTQFADPIGLGATLSLYLVVFAEFFCSVLIGIGLATRLATIPLIITMSVAAFVVFAPEPLAKKELPLLYLLIYLVLLILGSGKFSVDYILKRKRLST